jgi:hypothetical protein
MLEEDGLDKLFLQNICGGITEEVMDLGVTRLSYQPKTNPRTTPNAKGRKETGLIKYKMKEIFCNCNGFKDPKNIDLFLI